MTPLVSIEGVSRRFGSVTALDDVSLRILPNEFFALLVGTAHRYEGTTISMAGDCLMVAFSVPL